MQNTLGSSKCSIGNTIISSGVNILVGSPSFNLPKSGELEFNVSFGPICSSKYDWGKSDEASVIEMLLGQIYSNSNVIDVEQLCIELGKYAFKLEINLVCICNDGNVLDACILAATAALRSIKIPAIQIVDNKLVVNKNLPTSELKLRCLPIPITIGIFNNIFLLDPSCEEESYIDGKYTAVVSNKGDLICIQQNSEKMNIGLDQYQKLLSICINECDKIKRDLNWF